MGNVDRPTCECREYQSVGKGLLRLKSNDGLRLIGHGSSRKTVSPGHINLNNVNHSRPPEVWRSQSLGVGKLNVWAEL